ncbi:MAG: NTP transferase domain-containing protein [Candidatus Lokiarchaeota archaeon]|nr:NTP transferase domain-containing protein [Candidatus Lokiarchaeota archaeon]MBD3198996.1 NTP transferase domain-containing protein [Candidatus Lokiarchaeota archaeon]
MTKGVILSGGWGTRLRPLTCTIPKTLIPVANKPVVERQMLLLKKAGVKEIILAVSVMDEYLKNYFKDGEKLGLKIHYTKEESPMGTAGALKIAQPYLEDENFFMLNGDVILNFSFKEMLDLHLDYGGIGTIASRQVDDPSRYGVLIIDEKTQKIEKFLEKELFNPRDINQNTMPVNAGVSLLEPEIFTYIPPRKKLSIERDIYPKLTKKGLLYHYPISGIWKDIGKPHELLNGNILLLKELLEESKNYSKKIIAQSADINQSVRINPPVMIGEKTIINESCEIGPNVIIGDNVYIEKGSKVRDSLIYKEVYISENTKINKAIISDNSLIRKGVEIRGNENNLVILSSYVQIQDNLKLICPSNTSITVCHHEVVKEDII